MYLCSPSAEKQMFEPMALTVILPWSRHSQAADPVPALIAIHHWSRCRRQCIVRAFEDILRAC
jgi:hypothetical protein